MMPPSAVVLLNMGGPGKEEEIRPFLQNLFADREIIRLPFHPLLSRLIVFFRMPKVIENYRKIGGGSPLLSITRAQAQSLEQELERKGNPLPVFVAMRYTPPRAEEVVREVVALGAQNLLALPLYPHYSAATTGSSFHDLSRAVSTCGAKISIGEIRSWCDHPAYLDVLAKKVKDGLDSFSEEFRGKAEVIFSAHALPQRMIDEGDPYLEQIQTTVQGVLERTGPLPWHLAFQSRSGPVKWMRPGTEEVINDLAARGKKALLMVPVSFVSDHIETLYEIDILYKEQAFARGIVEYRRTDSLNTDPAFIAALARIVEEHLGETKE
jgi:ferrochelatase